VLSPQPQARDSPYLVQRALFGCNP